MRTLSLFLVMLAISFFSQGQNIYVKLTDPNGVLLKGDAVDRGYEGTIRAFTISTGGKNNTQVTFTMSINGASATLKKVMNNGTFLLNGLLTVLEPSTGNYAPRPAYTITMEKIKVISCTESLGCNGVMNTSVIIQAARTGWTYYQRARDGSWVLASKYGYDAETGAEWKGF